MHRMAVSTQLLFFLLGIYFTNAEFTKKLLLVSMDGFRWDYLNKVETPNFDRLAAQGVKAPYITSPFITKTFPSHYTIVTGLYEESHGIVGNRMFDPVFNRTFTMRTTESRWWSAGEPIWITARKNNLTSATYFWPGSEVEIQNLRPNIWLKYDKKKPFKPRVDQVIKWLTKENINMVTLYFFEPDMTGHIHGPNSPEVLEKVKEMDDVLGYLLCQLDSHDLTNQVNLIVTSDHGMTEMNKAKQTIDVTKHVNMSLVQYIPNSGAICHVLPKPNKTMEVYMMLKDAHPNMTVYLKEDLPERYHYKNNRRVLPIVLVADEGWNITPNLRYIYDNKGAHGYDNELMSMKPIFVARGPNFKKGFSSQPFNSVDIYPMMCTILGISDCPKVNGTMSYVQNLLTENKSEISGNDLQCDSPSTKAPTSGTQAPMYSTSIVLLFLALNLILCKFLLKFPLY